MFNLKSGEETALMSGDVIHHPQLIRPEWSSRACEDPHLSAVSRTKMLEVADTNTLLYQPILVLQQWDIISHATMVSISPDR